MTAIDPSLLEQHAQIGASTKSKQAHPDESFWKDVFEHAKSGKHVSRDGDRQVGGSQHLAETMNPDQPFAAAPNLVKAATHRPISPAFVDVAMLPRPLGTPLSTIDVDGSHLHVGLVHGVDSSFLRSGGSAQSRAVVSSVSADQTPQLAAQGQPVTPSPVKVVTVEAEDGSKKLYIRAKLSNKQALEATALIQGDVGPYTQVYLNGRAIYDAEGRSGASAFNEFSC